MNPVEVAFKRFRLAAVVVGVGLLVLVLSMILKYGFDIHILDWWSPVHGFLYICYLAATMGLSSKLGWPILRTLKVMLAGTVPLVSFVMERKVAAEVAARG